MLQHALAPFVQQQASALDASAAEVSVKHGVTEYNLLAFGIEGFALELHRPAPIPKRSTEPPWPPSFRSAHSGAGDAVCCLHSRCLSSSKATGKCQRRHGLRWWGTEHLLQLAAGLALAGQAEGAMTQLEPTQMEPTRMEPAIAAVQLDSPGPWQVSDCFAASPAARSHGMSEANTLPASPGALHRRVWASRGQKTSPNTPQLQSFFEARREKESTLQIGPFMQAQEPEVAPTMPVHAALTERLDLDVPVENRHESLGKAMPCFRQSKAHVIAATYQIR
ncbi:hypothetical protein AK812_SmicGene25835 [Symbiodinium microadriaticum]|uniref:Uncharacterized protein n=1 Tax=Symbiodinium microadriaticum TaxID=2951 RepID=A0A1Q9DAX6_SYMMI|nr:hypothetical protein AK812_SmicGene25835 [Symbiodinium microadriaticum]